MAEIPIVDTSTLDLTDTPRIEWVTVKNAYKLLWEKNPKLHDVGSIVQSILEHGWQEIPKYDSTLAAIKAGNGRIEAIYFMERDGIKPDGALCPRGIIVTNDGDWAVPVLFGVDAPSVEAAEAYAVDSNNLVMAGGDFTTFDYLRMWDADGYIEIIKDLSAKGVMPKSVDQDDLDFLLQLQDGFFEPGAYDDGDDTASPYKYTLRISSDDISKLEASAGAVREIIEAQGWHDEVTLEIK